MQDIINLQELLKIYTETLCDKTFNLEIKKDKSIKIVFFRESMCHLMGLQYVFGKNKHFLGAKGYEKIKQGEITEQGLKRHNRKGFNYIKGRLTYFDEIISVVNDGIIYEFTDKDSYSSRINATLILNKDNTSYELNLFVVKDSGSECNIYTPVSFFPIFSGDKDYKRFTDRKKPIKKCN